MPRRYSWQPGTDGRTIYLQARRYTEAELRLMLADLERINEAEGRGLKPTRSLFEIMVRRDARFVRDLSAEYGTSGPGVIMALRWLLKRLKLGRLHQEALRPVTSAAKRGE